eukprot:37248-Rhodomonas_salina.2
MACTDAASGTTGEFVLIQACGTRISTGGFVLTQVCGTRRTWRSSTSRWTRCGRQNQLRKLQFVPERRESKLIGPCRVACYARGRQSTVLISRVVRNQMQKNTTIAVQFVPGMRQFVPGMRFFAFDFAVSRAQEDLQTLDALSPN